MYIVVECSDNGYFGVVNTDNMEYKVLDREKFSGLLRSTEVFNWDKN